MKLGENDASIPFSANRRLLCPHPRRNVYLANRGANHPRSGLGCDVIDDPARREIGYDRALSVSQDDFGRQRQSVVLPDRHAFVRNQCQSIYVRIDRHPEIAVGIQHELLQLAQILRHRLRRTWKSAIRLHVDRRQLAAEELEENGHEHATGSAHTVQANTETPLPYSFHVEKRQGENLFRCARARHPCRR